MIGDLKSGFSLHENGETRELDSHASWIPALQAAPNVAHCLSGLPTIHESSSFLPFISAEDTLDYQD